MPEKLYMSSATMSMSSTMAIGLEWKIICIAHRSIHCADMTLQCYFLSCIKAALAACEELLVNWEVVKIVITLQLLWQDSSS